MSRLTPHPPRPAVHFTPPANWMNDPNGLIRVDDVYHLFYQHNPTTPAWVDLHWGHATSRDLVHWTHHPIALSPDEHGEIYSGSVVADPRNTAGFGAGTLVAVFTHNLPGQQLQGLAYSRDGGFTWTKYADNPVLVPPPGIGDFRDPKVLWYPNEKGGGWWVMVLAVGAELWFYRSEDLKTWSPVSTTSPWTPWSNPVLEVADLLPVPCRSTGEWLWTLLFSAGPRSPTLGEHYVFWLPGIFDGEAFTPHLRQPEPLDTGPSFYAAMAWPGGPEELPTCIGWMPDPPVHAGPDLTRDWCGRMSIPRRIEYLDCAGSYSLIQRPVLPRPDAAWRPAEPIRPRATNQLLIESEPCAVEIDSSDRPVDTVRMSFRPTEEPASIVDIVVTGDHVSFEAGAPAPSRPPTHQVERVLMLIDRGSIEVFVNDGVRVGSAITDVGYGPTLLHMSTPDDTPLDSIRVADLVGPET